MKNRHGVKGKENSSPVVGVVKRKSLSRPASITVISDETDDDFRDDGGK
jgi:hypothetical protein